MKKLLISILFLPILSLNSLDLGLKLRGDYYGDIEPTTEYDSLRAQIYIGPSLSLDLNKSLDLYLSANLFYNPIGDETLPRLDNILREGYLRYHNSIVSLNIGQKFVNWGKVDFYSPINIINPVDLTVISLDNLDESKLPTPMVDLIVSPHYSTTVELIYEPFLRPYYTPDEEREVKANAVIVNVDTNFIHENPEYFSIPSNSFFISINHWSYWFDILLSYAWFLDPYPDFDISEISQTVNNGKFIDTYSISGTGYTTYNRAQLIGLGLSSNIKEWGIDGEAGLKITKDWDGTDVAIKNSELVTNIQLNRTFFTNWFTQMNFIYRYIINYDNEPESNLHSLFISSLNSEFQTTFLQPTKHTIYLALHLHRFFLHEKLYTAINGGVGFPILNKKEYETELFISPRVTYSFNDTTKLQAGVDLFIQGEEAGYIGRNKYKDNFYIKIIIEL
jgi:hypothetical protein